MSREGQTVQGAAVGYMAQALLCMPKLASLPEGAVIDGAMWIAAQEWARSISCDLAVCGCEGDPMPHTASALHHIGEAARIMQDTELVVLPSDLREGLAQMVAKDRSRTILARLSVGMPELTAGEVQAQRAYLGLPERSR